jgi:hypothetical protein
MISRQRKFQEVGKEDTESYRVRKHCGNCRLGIVVIIPKGKTIEGFLDSDEGRAIQCDYCGCQAFLLKEY